MSLSRDVERHLARAEQAYGRGDREEARAEVEAAKRLLEQDAAARWKQTLAKVEKTEAAERERAGKAA